MGESSGQAVAEFAMVLPLMLFLFLGMVELGNALAVSQSLTRLSREAANIASRGTRLDTVLTVVAANGRDLKFIERGGSVVSRIGVRADGLEILEQVSSPGFEGRSLLGAVGTDPVSFASYGMEAGNTHYVVEIFYRYSPITPFARLFESALPDPIYERAVF
ncbi:MAG: pilus assembly protein [Gemmatimonadetes bacterium]|nr:pilus assembly protein [Gemmatimonadota bacterium]